MRRRTEPIKESSDTLQQLQHRYHNQPQEIRLLALRLMKEMPSLPLANIAKMVGRSHPTLQRWWREYKEGGLEKFLEVKKGGGKRPIRIGEEGLQTLQQKLKEDGFLVLKEAKSFLKERYGVNYSLSGVWYLLRLKLKAKLKTGRPRSVRQDPEKVKEFKKRAERGSGG